MGTSQTKEHDWAQSPCHPGRSHEMVRDQIRRYLVKPHQEGETCRVPVQEEGKEVKSSLSPYFLFLLSSLVLQFDADASSLSSFAYILDVTVISSFLKHRKHKQFLELGNCADSISRFYSQSRYDDDDIQSSLFAIVLKIIDNLSNASEASDASERENYV